MKVGLKKLFLLFLRQNKVNLWTSPYIFHKSTTLANIKSVAFSTALQNSAFCGRQIFSFCGLRQRLRQPPPKLEKLLKYFLKYHGTGRCRYETVRMKPKNVNLFELNLLLTLVFWIEVYCNVWNICFEDSWKVN